MTSGTRFIEEIEAVQSLFGDDPAAWLTRSFEDPFATVPDDLDEDVWDQEEGTEMNVDLSPELIEREEQVPGTEPRVKVVVGIPVSPPKKKPTLPPGSVLLGLTIDLVVDD